MASVVVTGAHGFIGRHVARRFASAGWEVTGLGHGNWSQRELVAYGISFWHSTDISLDALITYSGKPDVIVHCAGSGSVAFSMSHPFEDYGRTVGTTAAVLEFMRLHSPRSKLVYPSSAAVYGMAKKLPIAESDPLLPVSPYGLHKVIAEMLCRSYASIFGLSVAVVRLFSIYGEGLQKQLLWDACSKVTRGDPQFFGSGAELRDWLHVADAANLIYTLAQVADFECPTVNGGSGLGVTVGEILTSVFECCNSPMKPLFTGQPRPGDPAGYQADVTSAGRFGWKAETSWREGVQKYVRWYKERGE
jgi:UDP-glucose 4-epimerase